MKVPLAGTGFFRAIYFLLTRLDESSFSHEQPSNKRFKIYGLEK